MLIKFQKRNKKFVAFINSKIIRNFIRQIFVIKNQIFFTDSTFYDSTIINDIFLRIYSNHFFFMKTIDHNEKTYVKKLKIMKTNMMNVDIVLKINWLTFVNFIINFRKNKWKIRKIVDEILNENLSIIVKKFENKTNITLINWFEFQNFIKKNEKFFYVLFSNVSKNDENIFFVNIIKSVIFSNTIKLFIFFCYFEFLNVFEKKNSNKFFKHNFDDHVIKIFSKKVFSMNFIYNFSKTELEMLRKYINENLKKKFIKFFKFSTKSFILFIKKSDDDLRLCVNYRKLNVITIKNRYFFFINESFNKFSKIRMFTKLNVRKVFHKIRIKNENEWKTIFKCRFEHYQYRIMFFELINVSTNF